MMLGPEDAAGSPALRRLEQDELRRLLDHDPDPKLIVDVRGKIAFASLQVEAVLGYPKRELIGQPIEVLIPPRFHEAHAGHLSGYFGGPSTRPMGPGLDLWALTRDGREIPVEISLSSIGEGDDQLVVASVRDVSARRAAMTEMQQLNQQLSGKTQELEGLVNDLQVFAQTASHDLRAPLRQITQFLLLVERRCGDTLSAEGLEYLQLAGNSARRLSKMVEDVLAYSHIGASEQTFQPVDLSQVLDSVLDRVRILIVESGVHITRDELPLVMADPAQIAQLLQNLISNALLYRGEASPAIHFSARLDGDHWTLSVRDNGVGIEPQNHLRIFEMFQRSSLATELPGSGVGLAICKRVIDRHHGRIWVESTPGVGATFLFTLPAVRDATGRIERPVADVMRPAA
jgi:PAS domain S-box-containing protein